MNIHRTTNDILFSTESIEDIVKSINAKQDKIMESFLELNSSMEEQLEEMATDFQAGIGDVGANIAHGIDMMQTLCATFSSSFDAQHGSIVLLQDVVRVQRDALFNIQCGVRLLQDEVRSLQRDVRSLQDEKRRLQPPG